MELFDLTKLKNKKHQHYVPQFYLEQWMSHDGFFVRNSMGAVPKIYPKKTTVDVGEENFFYRIEMDDVVWDMLYYRFGEEAKSNVVVAQVMQGLFMLKAMDDVVTRGIGIVNNDAAMRDNAREILDYLKRHHLENAYSNIEDAVSVEIESFSKSQNSDLWVPPTAETFMHILVFFCFQSLRTKQRMHDLESQISEMHLERGEETIQLTPEQKRSVMKCMLYILSYQLCHKLYAAGCSMTISKNHTKLNYLTSDCPAMYFDKASLKGVAKSFGVMPLSPKLLVHISVPDENMGGEQSIRMLDIYDVGVVKKTNELVLEYSHNFVFAKKKKDLRWE